MYIDGQAVDISAPVEAEYGIHQLMAKAEGYQTVTKYIKVGQESATIEVVMEKVTEETVSGNDAKPSVSDNDIASTTGGKLTIDAPSDVEVYVDGSYVGITPVAFTKTAGIHVITLRASGYETKSYTINIENTDTNESMSFSALVKEEEEDDDGDTKKEDSKDNNSGSDSGKSESKEETPSKEPAPSTDNKEPDDSKEVSGNDVSAIDTEAKTVSENNNG